MATQLATSFSFASSLCTPLTVLMLSSILARLESPHFYFRHQSHCPGYRNSFFIILIIN